MCTCSIRLRCMTRSATGPSTSIHRASYDGARARVGRSIGRTRHVGRDVQIEERWKRTKHGQVEDVYVKVAQGCQFIHGASGELRVG
jgi:hypothetical protein